MLRCGWSSRGVRMDCGGRETVLGGKASFDFVLAMVLDSLFSFITGRIKIAFSILVLMVVVKCVSMQECK